MKWITWDQAFVAAVVSFVIYRLVRDRPPTKPVVFLNAAAKEMAFISSIYSVWRIARQLPIAKEEGALQRARQLADLQDWLRMPSELSIQHYVIERDTLASLTTWYYAAVHVPSLIAFLIWLYLFRRQHYPRWRTALALTTFFCLVIRFVRVAPPRFLPELGFVNLSDQVGIKVYGSVGSGVSDQFAAMPSIHIAWAAVVTFGVIAACSGRWRWIMLLHLAITFFVVAATGHHWWFDGIVAVGLLWLSLGMETTLRKWQSSRAPAESRAEEPVSA